MKTTITAALFAAGFALTAPSAHAQNLFHPVSQPAICPGGQCPAPSTGNQAWTTNYAPGYSPIRPASWNQLCVPAGNGYSLPYQPGNSNARPGVPLNPVSPYPTQHYQPQPYQSQPYVTQPWPAPTAPLHSSPDNFQGGLQLIGEAAPNWPPSRVEQSPYSMNGLTLN